MQLYKSLVLPHLEFCTAAWSPHYVKDKELLEKDQRRFTRMIPGLKDVPYNVFNIKQQYPLNILGFV